MEYSQQEDSVELSTFSKVIVIDVANDEFSSRAVDPFGGLYVLRIVIDSDVPNFG